MHLSPQPWGAEETVLQITAGRFLAARCRHRSTAEAFVRISAVAMPVKSYPKALAAEELLCLRTPQKLRLGPVPALQR
jgi:hypothetical protein